MYIVGKQPTNIEERRNTTMMNSTTFGTMQSLIREYLGNTPSCWFSFASSVELVKEVATMNDVILTTKRVYELADWMMADL